MWDFLAALEVFQIVLGMVSCLYFLVGIQLLNNMVHRRGRQYFSLVLIAMSLTILTEQCGLIIFTRRVPDLLPLFAAVLYFLALLLQIDRLCPCPAEEDIELTWHAFFGSWAAMVVFDIVAIITLVFKACSLTLDWVCTAVVVGIRCLLEPILLWLYIRPDEGGILLSDENGMMGTDNSNRHDGGQGFWGLKKFQIFLLWIWPSRAPWIKLDVSFRYPAASGKAKLAFRSLTLSIAPGETVAFVGPTGVGKSTLFSLIARLFDPDEGSIEVEEGTHEDLKERKGVYAQLRKNNTEEKSIEQIFDAAIWFANPQSYGLCCLRVTGGPSNDQIIPLHGKIFAQASLHLQLLIYAT
ncbi:hypothetical protein BHE90_015226 [Fusarium euwallaceae]|uniref:ABC transporter domain-containing protein n=1 Tax=Fusarium euwallaceae TaxID=1147111 RepID=A0A430L3Y0_9HYPO|nr:hypothetical protein BHE90_015226 [Fusarium euwallaceae]